MKKLFITTISLPLLLGYTTQVFALTPTPSLKSLKVSPTPTSVETPTDTVEQDRIQKIKEMVAEKVSKLKLVDKRGFLGTVKQVTNTQITIEDDDKNTYIIDTDELTKFEENTGSTSKTFGISDIKPGDYLSFVGLYNKETKRLLARVVTHVKTIPLYFEGVVISKDIKNFTLLAVDGRGNKKTIDFENSTKTQSYNKDDGIVKSGFTKIETGQRIFAAGFADKDDATKIVSTRVIYFTEIPASDQMQKFQKINSGSDTPVSSGSGKKLTPITK